MKTVLSAIAIFLGTSLLAQRLSNELIIEVWPDAEGAPSLELPGRLLADHIYHLRFADSVAAGRAYTHYSSKSGVRRMQYNHRLTFRSVPDDPLYPRQDNFERAGFGAAWSTTTGGFTADGVPIVTAVLDRGFDAAHEDIVGNLWKNPGEIIGDGIDNDGNGFVDDVVGWNFVDDTTAHSKNNHGTQVAGLIGAIGNNSLGVVGASWEARLMLLSVATVADVVRAYDYVLEQRTAYNESNGLHGALIVATNASLGVENGSCVDFPVWGGMYDRLAGAGVINVASVANATGDIDVVGDMPGDCPSRGLLTVTNVDVANRLHRSAGYGKLHVDLGAPGEGSFSTRTDDRYGAFGSTSASAAYVTGAVTLLHASPCPSFADLLASSPERAAMYVKDLLIDQVAPLPGLFGRSVSGGSLNVAAAMEVLLNECRDAHEGALNIVKVFPNPASRRVTVELEGYYDRLEWALIDLLGRRQVLEIGSLNRRVGYSSLEILLPPLAAGAYLLEARSGDAITHRPLVITGGL